VSFYDFGLKKKYGRVFGVSLDEDKGESSRRHSNQHITRRKNQTNNSNTKYKDLMLTQMKDPFALIPNEVGENILIPNEMGENALIRNKVDENTIGQLKPSK